MKNLILLFLLSSCAHQKPASDKEIDLYCQDLNVLYQKIEVISGNIANEKTTRTAQGGPYKRKIAKDCKAGICKIVNDNIEPILTYEPNHPDANKNGYVAYPSINLHQEKADTLRWQSVYEAVINNAPVPKGFFFKDPRANSCFAKYPSLKASLDHSKYLGRD